MSDSETLYDPETTVDTMPTTPLPPGFRPGRKGRGVGTTTVNIKHLEAALRKGQGLISAAARIAQCSQASLRHRIAKSPRLQQVLQECREELVDLAELSLRRRVVDGEGWAVVYALRTLGRTRGYAESNLDNSQAAPLSSSVEASKEVVRELLTHLATRPELLTYAQSLAQQRCLPLDTDSNTPPPLLTAKLVRDDAGMPGSDGERGEVGVGPTPQSRG